MGAVYHADPGRGTDPLHPGTFRSAPAFGMLRAESAMSPHRLAAVFALVALMLAGCMSAADHQRSLGSASEREMTVGVVQKEIHAGLTQAEVDRVVAGPDAPGDAFDGALLRAADELYRDDVIAEATWAALAARYDAKQLLDVLTTIGGYRMVSMALNSLGVQLEPNPERFPASQSR